MTVKVLQPFPFDGRQLQVGEELTMSKAAFEIWSRVDHVKEVHHTPVKAPAKSGKAK